MLLSGCAVYLVAGATSHRLSPKACLSHTKPATERAILAEVSLSSCRWMYWTDWEEDPKDSKRGKIERSWMDGTNRNVFLTSKTVLWPNGLSLDIPQGILYWVDAYYDRIEMVYLNNSERKVRVCREVFGCGSCVCF